VNDLTELTEYAAVHARGQRIADYRRVLGRIDSDDGDAPGSWVGEWCRIGDRLERLGRDLDATRYYTMARFPFVDGPARAQALDRCTRAFDRWRRSQGGIEPLEVELKSGRVRCWTAGLSDGGRRPLLIVMGGIVTIKEQWAPILARLHRLGMAGLVTEMPGTGENTTTYDADSWQMLPGLLDAVADRADVDQTHAIALSFSGHMALRCAVDDPRLRSIITVGAPVARFFTDLAWQRRLPRITRDTLAHLTGLPPDGVAGGLREWALTKEQLAALEIPVYYVASLRDEITPAGDVQLLRDHVRRLDLVAHDDVHASPRYAAETQLWTVASLLRARGVRNPQSALIGLMLRAQRLNGRLVRRLGRAA
jgi:pimeloyl-ACP methyl ester carboxylesterase